MEACTGKGFRWDDGSCSASMSDNKILPNKDSLTANIAHLSVIGNELLALMYVEPNM
jgi:hypothetical protein